MKLHNHISAARYLCFPLQTGFWGLFGKKVDAIDFYTSKIDKLCKDVSITELHT